MGKGQPAARVGDPGEHKHGTGAILEGCKSVRIEGQPAARVGDKIRHKSGVEIITTGEPTVRIGGSTLEAARTGDKLSCTGVIALGSPTVRIGLTFGCTCLQKASDNGTPFVQPAEDSPAHGPDLPPPPAG